MSGAWSKTARDSDGRYDRHLHIFANLASIAQPGDRILLIIGMGHTPILRELVRSHPGMQLVEALDYLG